MRPGAPRAGQHGATRSRLEASAAKLRGQAEALNAQHAELMQVLKEREGERPAPKGGKR